MSDQSCVRIPTSTVTSFFTSTSFSTEFSASSSTEFSLTTTATSFECVGQLPDGVCPPLASTTKTDFFVTSIPESTIVTSVPFTTTESDIVSSTVITLFSTSCATSNGGSTSTASSPSSTASLGTSGTSSGTQSSTSSSTNSVTTSSSVSGSPAPSTQTDSSRSGTSKNLGAIIGGTVGGFAVLAILIVIIWFIIKRRQRWDDVFDKDEDLAGLSRPFQPDHHRGRFSLSADVDSEPKPYQYGNLGRNPSPLVSPSPSPSLPNSGHDGHAVGTSTGYRPDPQRLHVPIPGSPAYPPSTNAYSTRPSTANSIQPLMLQQQQQQQQSVHGHGRSPSSQSMSQQSSSAAHYQTQSSNYNGWMGGQPGIHATAEAEPYLNLHRPESPASVSEYVAPLGQRLRVVNAERESLLMPEESGQRQVVSGDPAVVQTSEGRGQRRDEKRRMSVGTAGNGNVETGVLVHLDGGRYHERNEGSSGPRRNGGVPVPPPAYVE